MKKANRNVVLLPKENVIVCVEKKCFFLRNPFSLPKNVSCNRRIVFVSPRLILSVSYELLLSFSYNCFSCLFVCFFNKFPIASAFPLVIFAFFFQILRMYPPVALYFGVAR